MSRNIADIVSQYFERQFLGTMQAWPVFLSDVCERDSRAYLGDRRRHPRNDEGELDTGGRFTAAWRMQPADYTKRAILRINHIFSSSHFYAPRSINAEYYRRRRTDKFTGPYSIWYFDLCTVVTDCVAISIRIYDLLLLCTIAQHTVKLH